MTASCDKGHTWHEDDDPSGCLHEEFCNLINGIKDLPNADEIFDKIEAAIKAVAESEVSA